MDLIETTREFGGWLNRYQHASASCHSIMTFSVYLPPQAQAKPVPAVYWLSGLTCTDDNFRVKAGAQRYAAELGLALIIPDTSPRGDDVPDEPERYDLGQGAGFYVNATQTPWSTHYHMFDYVTGELPTLVERELPLIPGRRAVSGHSMGGHGALVSALRNPGLFVSASAFAPISNPVACPWGETCFGAYLGEDRDAWRGYDATCLVSDGAPALPMLVDQGTGDEFLEEQLHPANLESACRERDLDFTLRMQPDYDHSYHFIATFIGEHLAFHQQCLA